MVAMHFMVYEPLHRDKGVEETQRQSMSRERRKEIKQG